LYRPHNGWYNPKNFLQVAGIAVYLAAIIVRSLWRSLPLARVSGAYGRGDDSMSEQTRIVIVDDHPFVREGLKQLLAGQGDFLLVGEAASVDDARTAITAHSPDVAVVDLALGNEDGVDLVRWMRQDHPNVRVLVLSMQDEALYAERLLRLGVSGYVMKNVAGTDFLTALRKVARGQRHLSSAMGERLLSQVAKGRAPGNDEDPVSALTGRELEVFRLIGEGVSTREISERLDLSMKTVDAHRRHMREKLNLRSTSELIRYATRWVADRGDGDNPTH
jgi:DNA-binding NarL/FixJ family response regulator